MKIGRRSTWNIGLGIAMGVAFGVALDNVALGIALGLIFGGVPEQKPKPKDDESTSE